MSQRDMQSPINNRSILKNGARVRFRIFLLCLMRMYDIALEGSQWFLHIHQISTLASIEVEKFFCGFRQVRQCIDVHLH